MDARIEIIMMLVRERYSEELSLQNLSEEVRLTREHLCRLFKAETGTSPARYLKAFRLNKGTELLSTTLLSVKEITYKVGMKDESHFVRDFKVVYGLTPTQYRARNFTPQRIELTHINSRQ